MSKYRESKLTIWTLIICFALLTAYFCTPARADDSPDLTDQEVSTLAGMCFAMNTVDPDKDGVADWWWTFLVAWTGSEQSATIVANTIIDMTDFNQSGTSTWNDGLEACANARYEIIQGMKEYERRNADT
mgnify:CR=1 FL=1